MQPSKCSDVISVQPVAVQESLVKTGLAWANALLSYLPQPAPTNHTLQITTQNTIAWEQELVSTEP